MPGRGSTEERVAFDSPIITYSFAIDHLQSTNGFDMKQKKRAITVSTPDVQRSTRRKPPCSYAHRNLPVLAKDVPTAIKEKMGHECGPHCSEEMVRLALKAERTLLGPMPVDEFLQNLPHPSMEKPRPDATALFDGMHACSSRVRDLCTGLTHAFERSGCCSSVKFISSDTVDGDAVNCKSQPQVVGYERSDENLLNKEGGKLAVNLGLSEICIQVRLDHDPFCDQPSHGSQSENKLDTSFLAYKNRGCYWRSDKHALRELRAFGRMVAQASEVCARQHRVFLFSMMIVGTRARLFRWDRSGIIVTESFDYVENPKLLCEFLWRFGHATPVQRGYDPTVTVASAKEESLFKDNIAKEVAFQLGIKRSDEKFTEAMKRHYEVGKVTKVKVFDDKSNRSEWIECLVSIPVASPRSVTGRGTRGYWAVILTGRRKGDVVFLKDIWRIDSSASAVEGEIYDEMMEADVENISKNLYDGDVLYEESESGSVQTTLSQEFINESWMDRPRKYAKHKGRNEVRIRVHKHNHYRMILEDVGYPLSEFTGSRELFEAARDVVIALISAYEKCNRLHRDVSINNIILVRRRGSDRRKGVLIDWELSAKADREGCSTNYARSGTWAFMSAASLMALGGDFRHARGDDFESVLYVLIFASVHWLAHSYDNGLGAWIDKFFYDSRPGVKGGYNGGATKNQYITNGGLAEEFKFSTECISSFFSNIYDDLWSASSRLRTKGIQSTWTAENIMNHLNNVCRALARIPHPDQDRVINDMTDYYRDFEEDPCASLTSDSLVSDTASSMVSDALADDSALCGKKRALQGEDDGLDALGNDDTAADRKRRRIDCPNKQGLSKFTPDSWKRAPSSLKMLPRWDLEAERLCVC